MTAETAPGQARATTAGPLRRAIHWYNIEGQIHDAKVLHHVQPAVKPGKR